MLDRRSLVGSALALGAVRLFAPRASAADTISAGDGPAPGAQDHPQIELRYAFSLSIFFKERIRIQSNGGRVFVPAVGGEIWGPRLQGRVVPYSGADYAGSHGLDASYILQASDGALIYINNHGFMTRLDGSRPNRPAPEPRNPGEVPNQSFVAPADSLVPLRMRLTPLFDAPKGPHEWMSRTVFVGHGQRHTEPADHTIFTYYEVL